MVGKIIFLSDNNKGGIIMKNLRIEGNIISYKNIEEDDFWDKFVDFLKKDNLSFIGMLEENKEE